ncbi:MAG: hypothetical protein ACI3XA_09945 [Clostridia bacterium]
MGKSCEWEQIFENLMLFFNFEARIIFFKEDDILRRLTSILNVDADYGENISAFQNSNSVMKPFLGEEHAVDTYLQKDAETQEVLLSEAFINNLFTTTDSAKMDDANLALEKIYERQSFDLKNEEYFRWEALKDFKEWEDIFEVSKNVTESIFEKAEKGEMPLGEDIYIKDEDIKLDGGQKRRLMELSLDRWDKEGREIRVESVREERSNFELDGDSIAQMVGEKLYEIMNKSAEGFYI